MHWVRGCWNQLTRHAWVLSDWIFSFASSRFCLKSARASPISLSVETGAVQTIVAKGWSQFSVHGLGFGWRLARFRAFEGGRYASPQWDAKGNLQVLGKGQGGGVSPDGQKLAFTKETTVAPG